MEPFWRFNDDEVARLASDRELCQRVVLQCLARMQAGYRTRQRTTNSFAAWTQDAVELDSALRIWWTFHREG